MNEFALIAISAIFSSNIIAVAGVGAVSLQSEKRNFLYMLTSSLFVILPVIIVGIIYSIIHQFILVPLGGEYLKLFIVVLLSVLSAFTTRTIVRFISKEYYLLYERTYALPVQTAICAGTMLIIDFSKVVFFTIFELGMFCVGFLLVQIIFYALYERLDNNYVLKPARNVPLMLYTLGIVSMILYAVGMFF